MSRAFYRKYRSKSLAEIVGQGHITDTLSRALQNNSVTHAYLFTGPKGTGKTSVARILAHQLNKLPYTDDSTHLDIIEIDAASNRRIDDIRELRDKVHIAPISAPYKVYIIDEVHMLTGESFNALLKTLEEPPAHVVFILATTEVHKLPATILSRTQRFHFRPATSAAIIGHLQHIAKQEDITISAPALQLIAESSDGSFRNSISLLDQLAAMSGGTIDDTFVEQSLGLAPSSTVQSIVNLLRKGARSELHTLLTDLDQKGVSPIVLSQQLTRALKDAASEDPRLYNLIDSLLELHKSSQPGLKLLVTLLLHIPAQNNDAPAVSTPSKTVPTQAKAVLHTVTSRAHTTAKPKAVQTKEPLPAVQPAAKSGDKPFLIECWPEILHYVKQHNQPLFSMLNKAEPRIQGDTLTLAFAFKLHQIKLSDQKYRTKLIDCIATLNYACPAIDIIHDASAKPLATQAHTPDAPQNKTASSVLAMMGGGEVVNA